MSVPLQPKRKPSVSIKNELTTHYVVSYFIILVCIIGLIYWALVAAIKQQAVKHMKDEIMVLQTILNSGDPRALQRKIKVSQEKEFAKLYIRILDQDSREITQTPEMDQLLPPPYFHEPVPLEHLDTKGFRQLHVSGKVFLVESLWLHVLGAPRIVHMALDVSSFERILDAFQGWLVAVMLAGLLTSSLVGRYITHRGLRPLDQIAAKSRQITASNLGERFEPDNWPVEMHELTLELDDMLDRLQHSFERLKSYAANLAHELRTPIANLMGEAEVVLAQSRDSAEYERVIESSLEEYQRLSRTIDSLLFLARADSQEVRLKLEVVRVKEEIHNLEDYYEVSAQGRAFLILCDPDLTVRADVNLFRRALSNLIMNAIKYSPEGGLITLQAERVDGHVEVTVADQGIGIVTEHLERLFERFYRVPEAKSLDHRGAGLGLAIVKSIMELHGGAVAISSEPGKGTKITLTFPAAD